MASIGKVVQITVSLLTAGAKAAGFGTLLIADYNNRFSELVRFYEDTDGMVSDGFVEGDAALAAAGQAFAQNPAPLKVAIGRRTHNPVITFLLTPTAVNTKAYKVTVVTKTGAILTATYTSDGTATVAEIVAGLVAALNGLAGTPVTATDTGNTHTTVTVVATTATDYVSLEVLDQSLLLVQNTTADNNTANDLDAINLADDSWYGLTLTSQGDAEVLAAASWTETHEKLMLQGVSGGDCLTGSTGDVMSANKTANRFRSAMLYHQSPAQHAGAAWLGSTFPLDPGSLTFAFRQLRNLDTSPLNPTQITNIEAKNGNYFTDIAGVSFTLNGKVASGEWIDITRDTDWFESQLGVAHLNVKLNNDKVPMTDKGIAMEEAAMRKVCKIASDAGFLDEATLQFIVPKVGDIPDSSRKARILDKLQLSANVQGAIHVTKIRATITE